MKREQFWITWYEPGVYAGRTKSTMPMSREEAVERFPKFVEAATGRGWRFVRLKDEAGTTLEEALS